MRTLRSLPLVLLAGLLSAAHAQTPPKPPEPIPVLIPAPATDAELAAATAVVCNENDIESVALASFYMEKRGIPKTNLVALKCPTLEEITRREYDQTIATPLREVFANRGWWKLNAEADDSGRVAETKIRYVVLMRGMPLKITAVDVYPGDTSEGVPQATANENRASVDSELCVLGVFSKRITGVLANPLYRGAEKLADLPSQLLVCRLDGPDPADVRRMITDSIAAEKTGLRGFAYIDARGITTGGLAEGDRWLLEAARGCREYGMPVVMDNGPAVFPRRYPLQRCALYLGWYAEEVTGPFAEADFKFVPGAIAVHLHSFSGSTVRNARQFWVGPLVHAGAAATLGNVYEPFLSFTANLDIFAQRLREGFTFAEASYHSQRALSWMTVFVGDPLYRPFKNVPPDGGTANEWDAYRSGVRAWATKGRTAGESALVAAALERKSGTIAEGLGLLLMAANDPGAAIPNFERARAFYENGGDRIRVVVHQAGAILAKRGQADALAFVKKQIEANQASASVGVLNILASALAPAAKPKTTPKPIFPKP